MSRFYFPSYMLLITCLGLNAQNQNCANSLYNAQNDYEFGRFEKVPAALEECLESGFTAEQRREALALLAKTALITDDYETAQDLIVALVSNFPEYSPDTHDTTLFRSWVEKIRARVVVNNLYSLNREKVITASKVEEDVEDAPATIHVINSETIKARGYRNLEELLNDIPEIEIQRKSAVEFNNYYSFRGVPGNEKFIILLNGFRFNSPTGTPHAVAENYPLLDVARVEVILGPASALYGTDAFGGIVNIITKTTRENKGLVNLAQGQFSTREASVVFTRVLGRVLFSLSGRYYQSDEPHFPNIYPERYAWYHDRFRTTGELWDATFSGNTITLSETQRALPYATPSKAQFTHLTFEAGHFSFGLAANSERHSSSTSGKPEFSLFSKDSVYETEVTSIYGKHTFHGPKWSLETSLWRGSYETLANSRFTNVFTSYKPGYKYGSNRTFKFEEQYYYRFSKRASLIVGLSLEGVSALPKTGDLPTPFENSLPATGRAQNHIYLGTNVFDRDGNDLTIYQEFYNQAYENQAAYMQYRLTRNRWHVTLGGRYDKSSRYGGTFNPRAGLVFSPMEKMKLKLLYGQAFLAPSPYLTYQQYGSFVTVDAAGNPTTDESEISGLQAPFRHLPNPDLAPEKLRSWELALSWYVNDNLALNVDFYDLRVDDRVLNVIESNVDFLGVNVAFAEFPDNVGTLASRGGTARVNCLFPLDNMHFDTHLAWSYSSGDINGSTLAYSARNTIKTGATLRYKKFLATSNLLYRSKSYQESRQGEQALGNEGFTVIDMYARYDKVWTRKNYELSLYARVKNLLATDYTHVSFNTGESFTATPQDPQTFQTGVTFEF